MAKKAPARSLDPHDWKTITEWKTWAHAWCASCGTVRVQMEGTTIPFYSTPKNGVPCGENRIKSPGVR